MTGGMPQKWQPVSKFMSLFEGKKPAVSRVVGDAAEQTTDLTKVNHSSRKCEIRAGERKSQLLQCRKPSWTWNATMQG
jgi:hypothetical protein